MLIRDFQTKPYSFFMFQDDEKFIVAYQTFVLSKYSRTSLVEKKKNKKKKKKKKKK